MGFPTRPRQRFALSLNDSTATCRSSLACAAVCRYWKDMGRGDGVCLRCSRDSPCLPCFRDGLELWNLDQSAPSWTPGGVIWPAKCADASSSRGRRRLYQIGPVFVSCFAKGRMETLITPRSDALTWQTHFGRRPPPFPETDVETEQTKQYIITVEPGSADPFLSAQSSSKARSSDQSDNHHGSLHLPHRRRSDGHGRLVGPGP